MDSYQEAWTDGIKSLSVMIHGSALPRISTMCTYAGTEGRRQILPMLWGDTPVLLLAL